MGFDPSQVIGSLTRTTNWKSWNIQRGFLVSNSIFPNTFRPFLGEQKVHLLDIGAAGGLQSRWKQMLPYLQAFLFEPDERSFRRIAQNNDGLTYLNYALGGKEETVRLNLTRKPQCSSIYLPNRSFIDQFPDAHRFDVMGDTEVNLTTLDKLRETNVIPRIDFIKIDVEGYEHEILNGAKTLLGQEVIGIEVEVEFQSIRQGQPLFCDIHELLSQRGFVLYDIRFTYWKRRGPLQTGQAKGQIVFGDAIYFRSVTNLENMIRHANKDVGRRLAIHSAILFMIYGYYDCAWSLLNVRDDIVEVGERASIERFFRPSLWIKYFASHKLHNALMFLADLVDPGRRDYFKVPPMIGNLRDRGGATDSKAQTAMIK